MNQCLLFDNDGTLVDSERLGNIGLVVKFREYGVELDADELVIRFRGWKLATILDTLSVEYGLILADDFVDGYRSIVNDLFERELKPVDHIEEALKNLAHPKAVVSSGPLQKIYKALSVCGLVKYFGCNIYSSYEVKIWKPDPGIFLYAARGMGFKPEDCVVIDDGPVGVEAGCKAGMKTLFFNRFNEVVEYPSAISFTSMKQLPELINN
jgi:HAD superfamily hydrolase (TIGR01509 family)